MHQLEMSLDLSHSIFLKAADVNLMVFVIQRLELLRVRADLGVLVFGLTRNLQPMHVSRSY